MSELDEDPMSWSSIPPNFRRHITNTFFPTANKRKTTVNTYSGSREPGVVLHTSRWIMWQLCSGGHSLWGSLTSSRWGSSPGMSRTQGAQQEYSLKTDASPLLSVSSTQEGQSIPSPAPQRSINSFSISNAPPVIQCLPSFLNFLSYWCTGRWLLLLLAHCLVSLRTYVVVFVLSFGP